MKLKIIYKKLLTIISIFFTIETIILTNIKTYLLNGQIKTAIFNYFKYKN